MRKPTNLLQETITTIADSEHKEGDVAWVGSLDGNYAMSWERVRPLLDINYDSGFGGAEIADDLVVVFTDGSWLERGEYDGSEWWEFKQQPQQQAEAQGFTRVRGRGYPNMLAKHNTDDE
jgi:hypothetical protein